MKKKIFLILVLAISIATVLTFRKEIFLSLEALFSDSIELNFFSYILFYLIYVVATIFMAPVFSITILGGVIFGPVKGFIITWLGAVTGIALTFLISRYLFRDFFFNFFKDKSGFKKMMDGFEKKGSKYIVIARLTPIFPYNVENYAYGVLPIRFLEYVKISSYSIIPTCFFYSFLGGNLKNLMDEKNIIYMVVILGIVALIYTIFKLYKKKTNN